MTEPTEPTEPPHIPLDSTAPHQAGPVRPQPAAPPTVARKFVAPVRPGGWPMPIGIIASVLGGLGFFGGLMGALSPLFMPMIESFANSAGAPAAQSAFAGMKKYAFDLTAVNLLLACLGLFLCISGILLAQRRPVSIPMLRTWAVLKIVVGCASVVVQTLMQQEQMGAIAGQTGSPLPAGFFNFMAYVGGAMGLIWICVLPVFFLSFFYFPKIRAQTATWRKPRAPRPAPGR